MSSAARRLLLVHAHPDDETLTTGGTIARYQADPDTEVTVVTCTLGEQGEVIPPELAELAPDRADQLGGYRTGELAGALAALGGPGHRYLGGLGRWRDSGMVLAGHGTRAALPPDLHPRAFAAQEPFGTQLAQLLDVVDEIRPQVLVSYADDGGYGHPDHVRAHELTSAAATARPDVVEKLYFTVRSRPELDAGITDLDGHPGLPFRVPAPDELPSADAGDVTTRIDVADQRPARVAAMRAHATQISVWEYHETVAYAMSNGVAQPLRDVEEFVLVGHPDADETDLFDGIRS
ncbi:N-acetyl-1-D-myo-inositol-2-amino-2-deoxy-alpha-D-glucopyranoside deacetylase [Pseudonocardia endophytica]|uniref:1D-myo-inositol 2-acetamido-2-deoxy-alpha-D-glucopyranoside deacetylase n=1 Tax=Pseudonocardia endophytica TaxID=401976 RepID=A0A4R1HW31_PSEEN|nr:N-acetyl-1-D-myo-inositol-2-amino-2-deoxy-alpha-D-glucopyranoside deacetylase [Pseudonocardia endophytica]TCK26528.1 N-acetyl-1-D-myo-inositol-2-amino-2-deoxy-alpha-D-glucopyranoside deacetylase [Pseudonocardia endophytica]